MSRAKCLLPELSTGRKKLASELCLKEKFSIPTKDLQIRIYNLRSSPQSSESKLCIREWRQNNLFSELRPFDPNLREKVDILLYTLHTLHFKGRFNFQEF